MGFGKQYNILNEKERCTAQLSARQSPNHADLKYRYINTILKSCKKIIWSKHIPVIKKKTKKQQT